ncbi:hypothetical protein HMPREF1986_01168 [Oribacterium sp. oral taxon 078 str. F0263]|uniref:hypothetical protein n=1 Tax=Oribacterium sp. oral taxon 078 TaxID=652706 RepID=UPI0003AE4B35|nr:hypothetical protein [Oribacterium sp. oral taxon 078]ERL21782.1 hypothetical protein HMPREF1986_01168 [Oribacterium sp. oral taxon 078 str. F0263]
MLRNREIIRFGLRQFRENLGITLGFQLLHVFSLFLAGLFFAGIGLFICRPLFLFSETQNSGTVRVAIFSFIAIFIAFFALLLLFFTISCALGSFRFYLKLAFGRELNLFELFYGFSHREHFLRFAGVNLLVVLLSCPFLIPFLIQKLKGISTNLWILELFGLIFFTVITLFLAMAALASANDERLTAISSLRLSIRMMSRRKLKYFALLLPFAVVMYLLSLIFHGFFNIFFVPLVNTIVSVFFLSAYSEDFPAGTEPAGTEPGGESLREEKEFFENGEQRQEAEESGERREEIFEESPGAKELPGDQEHRGESGEAEESPEMRKRSFEELRLRYTAEGIESTRAEEESSEEKREDAPLPALPASACPPASPSPSASSEEEGKDAPHSEEGEDAPLSGEGEALIPSGEGESAPLSGGSEEGGRAPEEEE